jgi:hypothetical protein
LNKYEFITKNLLNKSEKGNSMLFFLQKIFPLKVNKLRMSAFHPYINHVRRRFKFLTADDSAVVYTLINIVPEDLQQQ